MTVRRRNLRKALVIVGCFVGSLSLPTFAFGLVLILIGAGLHLYAKGCLEQNRRLTTAGPYRWTRNPFYLANLLIDLGLCFVIGQLWVAWVYWPLWWISYRDTIEREEEHLQELFPSVFPSYRNQVPALFPDGRKLPDAEVTGAFTLQNEALARGAEYARVVGILISPWAIAAAAILRDLKLTILDGHHDEQLAFCLALPALWIWKLALAETFRRPQTRLIPSKFFAKNRLWVILGLISVSGYLLSAHPWAAILGVLWLGVAFLDEVGDRRSLRFGLDRLTSWSYFPIASATSMIGFGVIWLLVPLFRSI